MRWLLAIIVLDVAVICGLFTDRTEGDEADFVFVGATAHRFLDPQRMSWSHDIRIAGCLFEPLTQTKLPEMTVDPAAAESWDITDGGLTYTFHIRSEARWSNGDTVKATDFIFAWRRALMPDSASDYTQLLWVIKGAKEFYHWREEQLARYAKSKKHHDAAVQLLEEAFEYFDQTVGLNALAGNIFQVKLAQPVSYFLELCAFATFMPVHQKTVEQQASIDVNSGRLIQDPYWTRADRLVCNGPYFLKRRRFKRDLLMLANEYYWNRAAMKNSSILERIVMDPGNAQLLYESRKVDWLPDLPTSGPLAGNLVSQGRQDVHVIPAAGTYFYNFNCQPHLPNGELNPLSDARVRRALSMAIDRKTLVKNITRVGQPPARTFVPVGALPKYTPPVETGATFDPDGARQLLGATGYGSNGADLKGLSILYNTGFGHEDIAAAIKRMWKKHLGVIVQLQGLEVTAFGDRLRKHDFTIARAGWFGDYRDPTTFLDKFRTGNGNNDAAYSNEDFDRLMNDASQELDVSKRMTILQQAETVMLRDHPVAPIYQYVTIQLFDSERILNIYPNAWHIRRLELVEIAH